MFYELDDIEELLKCPRCEHAFDAPFMLPCGQYMCGHCLSEAIRSAAAAASAETQPTNGSGIQCCFCYEFHAAPMANGTFPISQLVSRLISKRPNTVYRSKQVDTLQASLSELRSLGEKLERIATRPDETIREHCDTIRNEVQIAVERAFDKIAAFHRHLLAEIDSYEKKRLATASSTTTADACQEASRRVVREARAFVSEQSDYLKRALIDDETVASAVRAANSHVLRLRENETDLLAALYANKLLAFDSSPPPLPLSLRQALGGTLRYAPVRVPRAFDLAEFDELNAAKAIEACAGKCLHHVFCMADSEETTTGSNSSKNTFAVFFERRDRLLCSATWSGEAHAKLANVTPLFVNHHTQYSQPVWQQQQQLLVCRAHNELVCYYPNNISGVVGGTSTHLSTRYRQGKYVLQVLSTQRRHLDEVRESHSSLELQSLAANANFVYGSATPRLIHAFDRHTLKHEHTINVPFAAVSRMAADNERLYVLDKDTRRLNILTAASGAIEHTIDTVASASALSVSSDFVLHNKASYIVALDSVARKLMWLKHATKSEPSSTACVVTEFAGCHRHLTIADSVGDSLVFVDKITMKLYVK